MNERWCRTGIAAALTLLAVAAAGANRSPETRPAAAGGLRVFVNPDTGAIEPSPATGAGEALGVAAPQAGLDKTAVGLVEVFGASEEDGVMVDLAGRFRAVMTVTMDADGHAVGHCAEHGPHTHIEE